MQKHILGFISLRVSSLLLTVSVRQALVDLLNSGKLGLWQMEGYMLVVAEHKPPTGRSWDACPEITRGGNKAFFSSSNQASRMGCLLVFVFGADQKTYSG